MFAARFGPLLGDEDAAERPFAADAESGQQAEGGELPDVVGDRAEKREERVAEDGEDQRAHAAEAVGEGSPEESESPADQEEGEEQAAVEADVARRGGDTGARQQVPQGGHQHQGIDEGIHAVQRPAAPGCPEAADLVTRERRGARRCYSSGTSPVSSARFSNLVWACR